MTDAGIFVDLDGEWGDRIGYADGAWQASVGTPYEARAIPHDSLHNPYFEYKVQAEKGLPPGWLIEYSLAAPWFGQPGGGPQYRIMAPQASAPTPRPSLQEAS